jgi:biotin carboxyl carrier protein
VELIVRQGEREMAVTVEASGDAWEVTLHPLDDDGEKGPARTHRVDAAALRQVGSHGGSLWSLVDRAGLDDGAVAGGLQREIAVAPQKSPQEGDTYRVVGRFGDVTLDVADPLVHMARAAREAAGGGQATVTAYMPGRVTAVLVEEGDEVTAGQGVVVLEAMKMENEIAAESAGVVTRLHVEAGQSVDGGDPLFDVGPAGSAGSAGSADEG